jgi:hypothetical protein
MSKLIRNDNRNCPRSAERVLCFLYSSAVVRNAGINGDPAWWPGRVFRRVGLSAACDSVWLGRLETVTFEEVSDYSPWHAISGITKALKTKEDQPF